MNPKKIVGKGLAPDRFYRAQPAFFHGLSGGSHVSGKYAAGVSINISGQSFQAVDPVIACVKRDHYRQGTWLNMAFPGGRIAGKASRNPTGKGLATTRRRPCGRRST